MIIGIDAHNVRGNGGSLIHLKELLANSSPLEHNFQKIIVWVNTGILDKLPQREFINYIVLPSRNSISSLVWQKYILEKEAKKKKCDILFFPGGIYLGNFQPNVAFVQSPFPFDYQVWKIYFPSFQSFIFAIKKVIMLFTFNKAQGVIFVTKAIKDKVEALNKKKLNSVVIHHGVSEDFKRKVEKERRKDSKIKILTVSSHAYHKNLISLVQAIVEIKKYGFDTELKIIGPETKYGTKELLKEVKIKDPSFKFIKILEDVPYHELPKYYNWADIYIAPSQCESFGLPLLEAIMNEKYIIYNSINAFEELIETYDYKQYSFKFTNTKVNLTNTLVKLLNSNIISHDIVKLNNFRSWNDCTKDTFKYINHLVSKKN